MLQGATVAQMGLPASQARDYLFLILCLHTKTAPQETPHLHAEDEPKPKLIFPTETENRN